MAFQDETLTCKDCGKEFVFTASEQEFYEQKGFDNKPQRCKECRIAKKNAAYGERPSVEITCSKCGKTDTVPFQPKDPSNVLCKDCFRAQKDSEKEA
jgi:CxxC-x17-CxxC domain-containing protein